MATIKQVVAKENLFADHFEFATGEKKIKVRFPVNTGVKNATLQGSTLKLELQDGSFKDVPLAGLIPAAKADKVLKSVRYASDTKEMVFTIGNDLDGNTEEVKVSVADFLPVVVKANSGLEGTGITGSELAIKVDPVGALKLGAAGIAIDKAALKPIATVHLQDAFGEEIGYAFLATERSDA